MFFLKFPKLIYDIKGDKNRKVVTDVLRRVKVRNKIAKVANLFDKYDVPDGETPETTAERMFGSVDYHWVILMTNNITDRYYGWPLSFSEFEKFIFDKYTNPDGIHHYEKTQSSGPQSSSDNSHLIECNSDDSDGSSVSNREYEQRLNDKKRQIKILDPSFLKPFIFEFERLINGD
tara:strand:- start:433 stop:960 length:528 start_codon:yes stop_codon:yes gene_type:complete